MKEPTIYLTTPTGVSVMGKTYRRAERHQRHDKPPKAKNMAATNIIALNRLHPGTFVIAHIPFDDDVAAFKTRPAIVNTINGRNITVHPCYSRPRLNAIEIVRANRTSYVTPQTVTIDQLDIVDIIPDPIPQDILDYLGIS